MSIIKPLFFDMECIFCDIQHIPRIFCKLYANSSCIFYHEHIWKSSAHVLLLLHVITRRLGHPAFVSLCHILLMRYVYY